MQLPVDSNLIPQILAAAQEGETFPNLAGYSREVILGTKVHMLEEGMIEAKVQRGDDTVKAIAITGVTEYGRRYLRQHGS